MKNHTTGEVRPPKGWSDAAWNHVVARWRDGASATEIASEVKAFGYDKTRNAIIGLLTRAGLSPRSPGAINARNALNGKTFAKKPNRVEQMPVKQKAVTRSILANAGNVPDRERRAALPVPAITKRPIVDAPPGGECWQCSAHTEIRRGRRAPYCARCSKVMYQRKASK